MLDTLKIILTRGT